MDAFWCFLPEINFTYITLQCVFFSSGDYDVALQGDESQGMSPTMRMKQDNRDCDKSYLVLPASDSFICKDSSGTIVSNTLSQPFLNDAVSTFVANMGFMSLYRRGL